MPGFAVRTMIYAPPARVFGALTDFARYPDVFRAVRRVEMLTAGPLGVGTRYRETRRMFGRDAAEEMMVTKLLPPRTLALESVAHGARYRSRYDLAGEEGRTVLTLTFDVTPQTFGAKVLGFLSGAMLATTRRVVQEDLQDLKRTAESDA